MALNATAGDAAADTYATLAEADTYFSARGVTAWTGTDPLKENALRRAASYLDNQYRERWKGVRTNQTQALAWPRSDGSRDPWKVSFTYPLLDSDGFEIGIDAVPTQLKNAQLEAAFLILTGSTLEPNLTRGGMVKSQSDTVGPLSTETVWQDGAPAVDRYTVIEGYLRGLVNSTPGETTSNVKLVRG